MLDAVVEALVDAHLADAPGEQPATEAQVFLRCRTAERRVGKVRATFRWYAGKYEQREVQGPEGYERLLLAADEVVRSCFDPPFAANDTARPTRLPLVLPRREVRPDGDSAAAAPAGHPGR